jgi:type III secretory pathway component EscV
MKPKFQSAYKSGQQPWDNPALIETLLERGPDSEGDSWCLLRWSEGQPVEGGLRVLLAAPAREASSSTFRDLREAITQKLSNGFIRACQESGWPQPRFSVPSQPAEPTNDWCYTLELNSYRTERINIHPSKVLVIGEEESLSRLLGLECVDPVFGLPAKWVARSQSEKASQAECLVFEASEIIMSHTISFAESRTADAIGHWEVVRWFSQGLPQLVKPDISCFVSDYPCWLEWFGTL